MGEQQHMEAFREDLDWRSREIEMREREFQMLESGLQDINGMMRDLALIVAQDGEKVDTIVQHIENTVDYTNRGIETLKEEDKNMSATGILPSLHIWNPRYIWSIITSIFD